MNVIMIEWRIAWGSGYRNSYEMSCKLREFHAVMSFLPAKKGCPYDLFCVVKCHEITFRLEPACQQSWFFYFLHFHEEPLWPWPIVAISHRGFISFLEIAEMGEKYAAVKEAQTQSADRAEWAVVLCSGVQTSCLWFLESLQIQNDTNVCCFFMGTNHLGSCSVKKSLTCKQCSACILQWNWAKFSVLPNA